MAFWERITGLIVAAGVGGAASDALAPVLETARQQAWGQRAYRVLDPMMAAEAAAADLPNPHGIVYADDAKRSGIGAARFETMQALAHRFPDVGNLVTLRRRGTITESEFDAALGRQHVPAAWRKHLLVLTNAKLTPADVANAIQQGFLRNAGVLPDPTPPRPDWEAADGPIGVPTEQVDLPPLEEAATWGVDTDRLTVLAELAGLPPGEETLLDMWRRGIIGAGAYAAGLREGHTKTKWTAALSARFYQLLPPSVLVNLRLRGWIEPPDFHRRMARHGFRAEQADDWFRSSGRPAAPVQMFTAWARGVRGPDGPPMDFAQFEKGIRQSDIRPEWVDMLWGIRHAYPSLFQLRRAVQEGAIDRARALTILRFERYEAADARALVGSWLAGTGTTAKGLTAADLAAEYEGGFVDRATFINELVGLGMTGEAAAGRATAVDARRARTYRVAVMARLQASFDRYRLTDNEALIALGELGVVADVAQHYVDLWRQYRAAKTHELTPAQVRKAYGSGIYDRPTALAELEERGYSAAEAAVYLDE